RRLLIIAERINTTRKRIGKAVRERDADFIRTEALKQAEAGATYIDANAGTSVAHEVDDLVWLTQTIQSVTSVPVCIDSANPKAIEAALAVHRGGAVINSITAERERLEGILPLVVSHATRVVALTMDDGGMPESAADRVRVAATLVEKLTDAGVERDRIHFDPLIRPISTNPDQARQALEATRRIMTEFEGVHTVCGLSNISFGLPRRNLLNRTFLALMIAAGLDGVIIDPTEPGMMTTVLAAEALVERDSFCMNYITAEREGRLRNDE
ncbi:MAG TPA: methyltetrahydrofolate cobalamin methyltransferase, partial [Planctomycetota bacterium]|nr:methyltetrahydrofolate cobalamin methyltransferase [Planctomycetota bacterium]